MGLQTTSLRTTHYIECTFTFDHPMPNFSVNSVENPSHSGTLEVHLLGTVDFAAWLGLQEYLTFEISGRNDLNGKLFLCEHPPLITIGREGTSNDLRIDEEKRDRMGLPVRWVARGGGAFPHASGQLAIYLMIPVDRLDIGPAEFRKRLEAATCESCIELKIPAKRLKHSPGIWGRGGQLGFFGSSVRSWTTNHGLFLNVCISPDYLAMTSPNSDDLRGTSIQAHRIQPVQMPQLRESLIRRIAAQFGYATTDVSTGHPHLKRTPQPVTTYV